jgi:hypothetical protein
MRTVCTIVVSLFLLAATTAALAGGSAEAGKPRVVAEGWEEGSTYNQLYDPESYEKIKGYLVDIVEVVPLPGMDPGLAVIMEHRDTGELIEIQMGPKEFVRFLPYSFQKGDFIKAKGAFAEVGSRKFFMASKLRNYEIYEIKVRRTSDGRPYWTMSKDELLGERLEE